MITMNRKITIITSLIATLGIHSIAGAAFSDLATNDDGSYTNWIGTITPEAELALPGWFDHAEHGWLYVIANGEHVYLYDRNVDALGDAFGGWLYTSRNVHPYFYVFGDAPLWLMFIEGVVGPYPTTRIFADTGNGGSILLSGETPNDIVEVAIDAGSFTSLATALTTAELVSTLQGEGPFTVFAPTDAAFANLDPTTLNALLTDPAQKSALTDILLYHVVPGTLSASDLGFDVNDIFKGESSSKYLETVLGATLKVDTTPFGVMINDSAMVSSPNVASSNGYIHVIDTVLLPPADIVDTAVNAGLSSLATAVTEAELVETLKGPGPFTVFAPGNEAFAALGDTLGTLLLPENRAQLQDILTYHVVSGAVYFQDLALGDVTMVNGDAATITTTDGKFFINGAEIIATDINTRNGVVHLIDAVILPPQE